MNALADKSYSSANELGNDRPMKMVYNIMSQRISMEDITGESTHTYNDVNRMIVATVCEGNLTKNYTFTYDANGNLTHECFGKQAEVVY